MSMAPIANGANGLPSEAAVPIAKTNRNVPTSSTAYFRAATTRRAAAVRCEGTCVAGPRVTVGALIANLFSRSLREPGIGSGATERQRALPVPTSTPAGRTRGDWPQTSDSRCRVGGTAADRDDGAAAAADRGGLPSNPPGGTHVTNTQPRPTTTDAGIPVASDDHSLTVGPDGPVVLNDFYLIEQMANFNRERVPERQPHAKGGGAFGHFEVTGDVSGYTRAAVFQPGARVENLIRFSTVAGERGSPDTWRDPRGFALRFYTPEGNLDIVGNNTPVFFIRDGLKFQHF